MARYWFLTKNYISKTVQKYISFHSTSPHKMLELIILGAVFALLLWVVWSTTKLSQNNTIANINSQGKVLGATENDFLVLDLPILPVSQKAIQAYNIYVEYQTLIKDSTAPIEYMLSREYQKGKLLPNSSFENSLWRAILLEEPISFEYKYFQLGNFITPLYILVQNQVPEAVALAKRFKNKIWPYRIDSPADLYSMQALGIYKNHLPLNMNTFQILTTEEFDKWTPSKLTRELEWYDFLKYHNINVPKKITMPTGLSIVSLQDLGNSNEQIYYNNGYFTPFVGEIHASRILGTDWVGQPTTRGLHILYQEPHYMVFNTSLALGEQLIMKNQIFEIPLRDIILNQTWIISIIPLQNDYTFTVSSTGIFTMEVNEFELIFNGQEKI